MLRLPKKIMIVDDEPDITSTFNIGLERNGFQIDAYNNSQQALSEFRPGKYDLLLLDIRMPGMSGFKLYHEMRKVDACVKACFLTAFGTYRRELTPALEEVKCFVKKASHARRHHKKARCYLGIMTLQLALL